MCVLLFSRVLLHETAAMLYLRHRKIGGWSETLGCALGTLDVATDVSARRAIIVGAWRGVTTITMPDSLASREGVPTLSSRQGLSAPMRCLAVSKACCLRPRVQDAAIQRDPTPILRLGYSQHGQTQSTIPPPRADFSGPMHPKFPSSQAPLLATAVTSRPTQMYLGG
jgi:hypothetical protein